MKTTNTSSEKSLNVNIELLLVMIFAIFCQKKCKLQRFGYRFSTISESVPIPNYGIEYSIPGSDSGRPTS